MTVAGLVPDGCFIFLEQPRQVEFGTCRGAEQRLARRSITGQPFGHEGFQPLEALVLPQRDQLGVRDVIIAERTGAAAESVIGRGAGIRLTTRKTAPEIFEFFVERFSHPRGTTAGAIISDPDARGVADDDAPVELRKFDGHTTDEVPGAAPAGEEIGHDGTTCWTKR